MDPQKLVDQVAQNVREAIDEAQRQAEEILGEAEAQAKRVRAEAEEFRAEAKRIRADAETDARRRLDEVQSALADLRGRLSGKPGSEVNPGPVTVPEPEPPLTPEPLPDPTPEPTPERVPEPMPEPVPQPTPQTPEPVSSTPASANGGETAAGDDSAARLVAMKLALDGTSRADARKQLAAEYDVGDLDGLLDDVYSKAGK